MTPTVGRWYLVAYRDRVAAPGESLYFLGRFEGAGDWTAATPIMTSRRIVHMVLGIQVAIADEDVVSITPVGRLERLRTFALVVELEELLRRRERS